MVIAEGAAIITGIKTTIGAVEKLKSSYDATTIMQAQSDILKHLFTLQVDALALQEKHLALIHEKEVLIKKLMEFEQWDKTESEYELYEIVRGKFVYSSKKSQHSKEPHHWLCPNCWNERKKSILQATYHNYDKASYTCPRCKHSLCFYTNNLLIRSED